MAKRFSAILDRAKEISKHTIAENSQATYSQYINLYEEAMVHLETEPYEINIDKMMVFIQFGKDEGYTYNTLKCCIAAFSYYFRSNNLPNLTQDVEFTNFHKGVLRDMKTNKNPNRKLPWNPQFFDSYLDLYPLNQFTDTLFLFYMTLSYYGFLRISELQNLKFQDIVFDSQEERLILNIRFSKTDQFGKGEKTFVYDNDKEYSPYKLYQILKESIEDYEYIVQSTGNALRSHLKVILKRLGQNKDDYSWHSFRRGGAYQAALAGVNDSEIKKHGRWKSDAYIRYVAVDPERAGSSISSKI